MSTTILAPLAGQRMAPRGEGMLPATAGVTMWRRAGATGVEAMGGTRLEAEQAAHHRLPFAAMRAGEMAILEVMDQPVGHLVGHHLDQEGDTVLGVEHRIEAQATAAEVGLAGGPATQVAPDPGTWQVRVHIAT